MDATARGAVTVILEGSVPGEKVVCNMIRYILLLLLQCNVALSAISRSEIYTLRRIKLGNMGVESHGSHIWEI